MRWVVCLNKQDSCHCWTWFVFWCVCEKVVFIKSTQLIKIKIRVSLMVKWHSTDFTSTSKVFSINVVCANLTQHLEQLNFSYYWIIGFFCTSYIIQKVMKFRNCDCAKYALLFNLPIISDEWIGNRFWWWKMSIS